MNKARNKFIRLYMFLGVLCILVLSTFSPNSWAATQASSSDPAANKKLGALSIEELMDVPVFDEAVTSVTKQTSDVRHSPAAVFVITSEMIHRSGATVIPELLRMVPGVIVGRMDGNKWAIRAAAVPVDGACDQFLSRAAFASQVNASRRRRHQGDLLEHRLHRGGFPHNSVRG